MVQCHGGTCVCTVHGGQLIGDLQRGQALKAAPLCRKLSGELIVGEVQVLQGSQLGPTLWQGASEGVVGQVDGCHLA